VLVRGFQRMNELQQKFAQQNNPEMVTAPGQGPDQFGWADIPQMANGGIVSSPTFALIGEAGPEAVIPLSGGRGIGRAGGGSISIGDVIVQGGGAGDGYELGQLVRIELKKLLDEAAATFGEAA
jgi:hypothetical protein